MKVTFGDKYRVVKEKNSYPKRNGMLLILPLLVQLLLSYLGSRFNTIFYFFEIIPVVFLFYLLHQRIKQNMVDFLIIIYIVLLLALFAIDLISL